VSAIIPEVVTHPLGASVERGRNRVCLETSFGRRGAVLLTCGMGQGTRNSCTERMDGFAGPFHASPIGTLVSLASHSVLQFLILTLLIDLLPAAMRQY
jgi:hypothetical protein